MKPQRNPRYLAFIRTQPCCVCGSTRGIEASHTGPHGLGQKSPDSSAIPLCAKHHRTGADSYHRLGPRKFSEKHNLNVPAIVRRLNLKPMIRVEAGFFVAYLDDQRYVGSDPLAALPNLLPSPMRSRSRLISAATRPIGRGKCVEDFFYRTRKIQIGGLWETPGSPRTRVGRRGSRIVKPQRDPVTSLGSGRNPLCVYRFEEGHRSFHTGQHGIGQKSPTPPAPIVITVWEASGVLRVRSMAGN